MNNDDDFWMTVSQALDADAVKVDSPADERDLSIYYARLAQSADSPAGFRLRFSIRALFVIVTLTAIVLASQFQINYRFTPPSWTILSSYIDIQQNETSLNPTVTVPVPIGKKVSIREYLSADLRIVDIWGEPVQHTFIHPEIDCEWDGKKVVSVGPKSYDGPFTYNYNSIGRHLQVEQIDDTTWRQTFHVFYLQRKHRRPTGRCTIVVTVKAIPMDQNRWNSWRQHRRITAPIRGGGSEYFIATGKNFIRESSTETIAMFQAGMCYALAAQEAIKEDEYDRLTGRERQVPRRLLVESYQKWCGSVPQSA